MSDSTPNTTVDARTTSAGKRRRTKRVSSSASVGLSLPLFFGSPSNRTEEHGGYVIQWTCFLAYFCSTTLLNLPVIFLPVVATSVQNESMSSTSLVASVASVAVFGSAVGKLINGSVCTVIGVTRSTFWYIFGLGLCTFWFSVGSPSSLPYANAGMEFFGSIQWTALSMILRRAASRQKDGALYFSNGIAFMSYASTGGSFLTKTLGILLLQYFDWQTLGKGAAFFFSAVGGLAIIVMSLQMQLMERYKRNLSVKNEMDVNFKKEKDTTEKITPISLLKDIRCVISNHLFWVVGLAHGASMLGRSSDRVLGAFFQLLTNHSPRICGGLTISSTLGLIYGLNQGKKFATLPGKDSKRKFLYQRYKGAVFATLSLSFVAAARRTITTAPREPAQFLDFVFMPSSSVYILAFTVWIAISAFYLASNTAVLFFQIPSIATMNAFSKSESQQAIALSALEAIAFSLVAAPSWKLFGVLSYYSYEAAWIMIGVTLAIGGLLLFRAHTVL